MSIQRQRRRGTAAENAAFTGALGEFIYVTDGKRIAAHDGANAGGTLIPSNRDLINDYFGYAAASGTDTITLTVLAQITAYAAGQQFTFKAAATNTGSATLNVNSIGAKTIKKKDIATGTIAVLEAGDLISGGMYTVRYDGTDMQLISTDGGGAPGWEFLSTQTASASAALDFTSLITADHGSYVFLLNRLRPATDGVDALIRTSTNNGSSFDSAAANYAYGSIGFNITGSSALTVPVSTSETAIIMNGSQLEGTIGNAAAEGIDGIVWLINPLNATGRKIISWDIHYQNQLGNTQAIKGTGQRAATSNIDAIRFLMSSGNITSGSINMYGMRI